MFQPGILFDTHTFEQILSTASIKQQRLHNEEENKEEEEEEEEDDDDDDDDDDNDNGNDNTYAADVDNPSDEEVFDQMIMVKEQERELQQLYRFVQNSQLTNDDITSAIIQQLNDVVNATAVDHINQDEVSRESLTTSSIQTITSLPYPPVNQTGFIADHDRPYADYGHLDRPTIANVFQFHLESTTASNVQQPFRLNTKSFAITSWTNASQENVMNAIKQEFDIESIQYICIGEELSELNHQRHLHIQIILKKRVNKKKRFLDSITQTSCNYQVTHHDRAWNEYIKKDLNFIEFGQFKSTTSHGQKRWPSPSSCLSQLTTAAATTTMSTLSSDNNQQMTIPRTTTTTTMTTSRGRLEEKRKHANEIAIHAFKLAETSISEAMDFIQYSAPAKFLERSSVYETTRQEKKKKEYNISLYFYISTGV